MKTYFRTPAIRLLWAFSALLILFACVFSACGKKLPGEPQLPASTATPSPFYSATSTTTATNLPTQTATLTSTAIPTGTSTVSATVTSTRTANPTSTATVTATIQVYSAGAVYAYPVVTTASNGSDFTISILVNTGSSFLTSYGISITYDTAHVIIDTAAGTNGVSAGADGFVTAVNPNTLGTLVISGFDATGKAPSLHFDLLVIHLTAVSAGSSSFNINVGTLIDPSYNNIGTPAGYGGTINVN
jgi:hypothetical protein